MAKPQPAPAVIFGAVDKLIAQAQDSISKATEKENSRNYRSAVRDITKARALASKYTKRLSQKTRRQFCDFCNNPLLFGTNCRVRLRSGNQVIFCLNCKKYTKYSLNQKNKETSSKN